jgi:hypothetical protein
MTPMKTTAKKKPLAKTTQARKGPPVRRRKRQEPLMPMEGELEEPQ